MRLWFLLFLLSMVWTHEEEKPVISDLHSHPNVVLVSDRTVFVPNGHDAEFKCYALESRERVDFEKDRGVEVKGMVEWTLRTKSPSGKDDIKWTFKGGPGDTSDRFLFDTESGHLYGYGMQKIHNETILECRVKGFNHIDTSQTISTTYQRTFVSRIMIGIQDCGENDDHLFVNPWNPCMYGMCQVNSSVGYDLLQCICVEQYTGRFCDVQVEDVWFWEILFYIPVLVHVVAFIAVAFLHCCRHRWGPVRRLCIADFIPRPLDPPAVAVASTDPNAAPPAPSQPSEYRTRVLYPPYSRTTGRRRGGVHHIDDKGQVRTFTRVVSDMPARMEAARQTLARAKVPVTEISRHSRLQPTSIPSLTNVSRHHKMPASENKTSTTNVTRAEKTRATPQHSMLKKAPVSMARATSCETDDTPVHGLGNKTGEFDLNSMLNSAKDEKKEKAAKTNRRAGPVSK